MLSTLPRIRDVVLRGRWANGILLLGAIAAAWDVGCGGPSETESTKLGGGKSVGDLQPKQKGSADDGRDRSGNLADPDRSLGASTGSSRLPRTGQTESVRDQTDGDLRKGVVWPLVRFRSKDRLVTDRLTVHSLPAGSPGKPPVPRGDGDLQLLDLEFGYREAGRGVAG